MIDFFRFTQCDKNSYKNETAVGGGDFPSPVGMDFRIFVSVNVPDFGIINVNKSYVFVYQQLIWLFFKKWVAQDFWIKN